MSKSIAIPSKFLIIDVTKPLPTYRFSDDVWDWFNRQIRGKWKLKDESKYSYINSIRDSWELPPEGYTVTFENDDDYTLFRLTWL